MIGRSQMTHWTDGDAPAARHLIEQSEKRLAEALEARAAARAVITHERLELRRRRRQLSQAEQHHG